VLGVLLWRRLLYLLGAFKVVCPSFKIKDSEPETFNRKLRLAFARQLLSDPHLCLVQELSKRTFDIRLRCSLNFLADVLEVVSRHQYSATHQNSR
jgi:hypothetical protein